MRAAHLPAACNSHRGLPSDSLLNQSKLVACSMQIRVPFGPEENKSRQNKSTIKSRSLLGEQIYTARLRQVKSRELCVAFNRTGSSQCARVTPTGGGETGGLARTRQRCSQTSDMFSLISAAAAPC
jgi:hypothetical protein